MENAFFMNDLRHYLELDLCIHKNVTNFLCDRPVPTSNEYWLRRSSYLTRSPGYLFIPILFDLFLKSGMDESVILSETHIRLIEDILHLAARQEKDQTSYAQLEMNCHGALLQKGISIQEINRIKIELVDQPFKIIPPKYQALRRANYYLYSGCFFPEDYALIFTLWESIMPLFLFMDDLTDLAQDLTNGSENCLLDSSDSIENNFFELHSALTESLKQIEPINQKLYKELDTMRQEVVAVSMKTILLTNK